MLKNTLLGAVVAFLVTGCGGDGGGIIEPPPPVDTLVRRIAVPIDKFILRIGDSKQVIATPLMASVSESSVGKIVKYQVSDPDVASVSSDGTVIGRKFGFVTITMVSDTAHAIAKVWVVDLLKTSISASMQGCVTQEEARFVDSLFTVQVASNGNLFDCPGTRNPRRVAYRALLTLAQLPFDPIWAEKQMPLLGWLTGEITGLHDAVDYNTVIDHVVQLRADALLPNVSGVNGFTRSLFTILHEARHANGQHPHTCKPVVINGVPVNTKDRTVGEKGGYGVEYYFYTAIFKLDDENPYLLSDQERADMLNWFEGLRREFCDEVAPPFTF